ncbi:MAG: hypothetical protein R2704_02215 [Microthrixaceae bacterium]
MAIGAVMVGALAVVGCGNDLDSGEASTTTSPPPTTEAVGSAPATTDASVDGDESEDSTTSTSESGSESPTGITLPDGSEITLPEGVDLSLPDGTDLTVPDGIGDCVEAGAALAELNLALLGATSTTDIDDAADQLKEALGSGSDDDVDVVAAEARKAAEAGTVSPGAYNDDAYTSANAALAKRIGEVCAGD